jgi:hypothetical protein
MFLVYHFIIYMLAYVYRWKYLNESSVMFYRMCCYIFNVLHTQLAVHTCDYFCDSVIMYSMSVETNDCVAVRPVFS